LAIVDKVETAIEGVDRVVARGVDPPAEVDTTIVCDKPWKRGDWTRSNRQVRSTSSDEPLTEQGTDLLGNTVPQIEPGRIITPDKNVHGVRGNGGRNTG